MPKMSIFLVTLVAVPLFLRSVIDLGFVAAYSLSLYIHETESGALAATFFYYFCTLLVFAGVVLIGYHLSKDVPEQEEVLYGPEAGTMMDSNDGHLHDGTAYFTNSQQSYAQVSQQSAPLHRGQSSLRTAGEQAHNGSARGDSEVAVQPVSPTLPISPTRNGHGAPHAMNW